jgi:two-component sensor histidine kinase
VTVRDLKKNSSLFSRSPMGIADSFGHYHVVVPEKVIGRASVRFAMDVSSLEAITPMQVDMESRISAAQDAVRRALMIGHVTKPVGVMLVAGQYRLEPETSSLEAEREAIRLISQSSPATGFAAFAEFGSTEDGLPQYCNASIVALVIGNELEPFAVRTRRSANALKEIEAQLATKTTELDSIRMANAVVLDRSTWQERLTDFESIFSRLTGAVDARIAIAPGMLIPDVDRGRKPNGLEREVLPLISLGRVLGYVELSATRPLRSLDTARSISHLLARGVNQVLMDQTIEEQAREIGTVHNITREILEANDVHKAILNIAGLITEHAGATEMSLWIGAAAARLQCETPADEDCLRRHLRWAAEALDERSLKSSECDGRTLVACPLFIQDRVSGVLVLGFNPGERMDMGDLGFLSYVTMPLAAMVEIYLRQRESNLAREIHHRVKNNLQVIASLLNLQMRRLSEPEARKALENSISRIMSISLVHEALSERELGRVEAGKLIRTISQSTLRAAKTPDQNLSIIVDNPEEVELSSQQASSLAIVVNELIANALKHGLLEATSGRVLIRLTKEDGAVTLTVKDDGSGLPPGFRLDSSRGLGLQLVKSIIEGDLHGRFSITAADDGVEASAVFPARLSGAG